MAKNIQEMFLEPLRDSGCSVKEKHSYGKAGICFSGDTQERKMDYWMYSYKDMFTISVSNMYFQEDVTNTFPLTDLVSIYYYDSAEGYELPTMQPIYRGRVAAFIPEGQTYTAIYRCSAPVCGVSINITPAYYNQYLKERLPGGFDRLKKIFMAFNDKQDNPEILMVMRQIQNCRITGSSAHLYYESKVNEAIALVVAQVEKNETEAVHYNQSDKQQLQQIERFLAEHYADDVSLAELSRIACMSVSKLKYTFKSIYGCNISEYINALQLDHAKKLLQYGTESVSAIAGSVGYKTTAAFSKMFKEKTGILPKDYRKSAFGAQ